MLPCPEQIVLAVDVSRKHLKLGVAVQQVNVIVLDQAASVLRLTEGLRVFIAAGVARYHVEFKVWIRRHDRTCCDESEHPCYQILNTHARI